MGSSVLDAKRSPGGENRDAKYEPVIQTQTLDLKRTTTRKLASRPTPRRLIPAEGWLPLLLLAIALYCVVWSIIAAEWVSHSLILLWSPAFGLLVGLIIAKLPRLPQAVLHLAACLIGHWLAIWLTSVVAFRVNWLLLLGGLRAAITGTMMTGTMPASEIVFFFYLAFLCFFLGYFGSWLVYRAHLPWLVALVYCSILLVNLNYVKQDLAYLVVILVGALILLIARVHLVTQIQRWTAEGLHTDVVWLRNMTTRCMQIASILTIIALLTGWMLPIQSQSASGKNFWDQLNNVWDNIINGRVTLQSIGSLTQPYQQPSNFFSDQLTVSGSVHLPIGQVLYYASSDALPHNLEGFTYNHFDGHTWTTSLTDAQSFEANSPLPVDIMRSDYTQVTTSVTLTQPPGGPKNYIFGPAQPTGFNTPVIVYGDGMAGSWTQVKPLVKGERYNVISMIPTTDSNLLSNVPLPAVAPDVWHNDINYQRLAADYIQGPQDLSPNVQSTMKQWTQGATNAYSALKLLESHLSDQSVFTYSVSNTPIPAKTDVVDWLLQTRSGYCTYYATAMAVMARQFGIPTRVVNGFSQGHYDVTHHNWVVDGQDAHGWVQAYLPSFGWVSFDPTPGFAPEAAPHPTPSPTATKPPTKATPVVTPPPVSKPTPPPPARLPPPFKPTNQSHPRATSPVDQNVLMGMSIAVLLLSMLVFLTAIASYWWRNLYAENGFVASMFWRLCWIASRAGFAPKSWQTPYEYSGLLSSQFPQNATPLLRLTDLFVRERWGPPAQAPSHVEEESVERLLPDLRHMFWQLMMRKVKK